MKSIKHGIIHTIAFCGNCDWDAALDNNNDWSMAKLRREIKKHIKNTGHTVTLETGTSTDYLP